MSLIKLHWTEFIELNLINIDSMKLKWFKVKPWAKLNLINWIDMEFISFNLW